MTLMKIIKFNLANNIWNRPALLTICRIFILLVVSEIVGFQFCCFLPKPSGDIIKIYILCLVIKLCILKLFISFAYFWKLLKFVLLWQYIWSPYYLNRLWNKCKFMFFLQKKSQISTVEVQFLNSWHWRHDYILLFRNILR